MINLSEKVVNQFIYFSLGQLISQINGKNTFTDVLVVIHQMYVSQVIKLVTDIQLLDNFNPQVNPVPNPCKMG